MYIMEARLAELEEKVEEHNETLGLCLDLIRYLTIDLESLITPEKNKPKRRTRARKTKR